MQAARSTPGKVLAVPAKGVLIVSLGSKQAFKQGDKLLLFQTVDTKDEKGRSYSPRKNSSARLRSNPSRKNAARPPTTAMLMSKPAGS